LGDEFNQMAGQLQQYTAGLEQKVEERTRDLREALEQQTAMSDILQVISSSPNDLQPVLDAVAQNAARLCEAHDVAILRAEGNVLRMAAQYGPLPMLAHLPQSDRLPSNMQRDLALAVFTRAVLLDEIDIANAIAPIVARYFPQYGAGWKAYQSAATPQQKKLEATLLLLRLPAASPWLASGLGYPYQRDRIGLYGPRWWSHEDADDQQPPSGQDNAQDNAALCDDCALPLQVAAPAFITPQERERARDDGARLRRLPGAPAYLGAIILAWANAQPRDPRVPEALYLVVRATRYGQKNSETSKAAYTLLHERYRRNPWTSKTPMWFSSPGDE